MSEETKKRPPLSAFLHHQGRAVEETGKAFLSLLPKDFRDHANNALEESKQGFEALFGSVIETVESGLDSLRSERKDAPGKEKIEVEIDD